NLAVLLGKTGRREQAELSFEQAVAIHRETGNRRFEGVHECSWAKVQMARDVEGARARWSKGANILKQLNDAGTLAIVTRAMRDACAKAGVRPFDE
ncbi:MAG: tetratricopeptide repeat protein, partial [Planctomycetes bacterium]|nr:tetratricopeptide repeat protein [Planctomycetota bacterium]